MTTFKVGDRVQFIKDSPANEDFRRGRGSAMYTMPFEADKHGRITRVLTTGVMQSGDVLWDDGTKSLGMFFKRLQLEVPPLATTPGTLMNSTVRERTMTFDNAKDARNRLVLALGLNTKDVIVRTRSWSHDGRYGAVEIPSRNVKLYTDLAVSGYIANQQTPIDAFGVRLHSGWRFTTELGLCINTPDGMTWWSETEIQDCKGLASFEHRLYRLCIKVVRPMYAEGQRSLTTE